MWSTSPKVSQEGALLSPCCGAVGIKFPGLTEERNITTDHDTGNISSLSHLLYWEESWRQEKLCNFPIQCVAWTVVVKWSQAGQLGALDDGKTRYLGYNDWLAFSHRYQILQHANVN